ncbi:ABC transporter ATP-binding protein [Lacticaseibacillus hulanensis]|uniref:ABC transporter ATP-binding protein n=1 Tax=Lacticaseibacillus hulanensis TaxID=2493111 RepID=UPI000FD9EA6D|nr:ABC transporter ATP-binding protein [Lacticaseibacillus hulanensis]
MESEYAIELEDIHKSFAGKNVLKGVSFQIKPGTIVGYIGQNGAGKSTTVKIILGLIDQDDGVVTVFGKAVDRDDPQYKRRIGYVPEGADLFDALTAREYLQLVGQLYGLTAEDAGSKAEQLAEIVGLGPAFDRRIASYSKGMRQLVLIIASLLHDPDILFWDEPLNGLDANAVLVIEEILQELRNRGKTIFYSSHIMDVVQKLSDRIILLNEGTVVADGTFKQLQADQDTSLQQLFNEMTGFAEHGEKAKAFVDIVMGGGVNETTQTDADHAD